MQTSDWHPDTPSADDDGQPLSRVPSPEALADRFGSWISLLLLGAGLLTMSAWLFSPSSFETCNAIENQSERYACYDKVRDEQSKPPAKGAIAPYTLRGAGE